MVSRITDRPILIRNTRSRSRSRSRSKSRPASISSASSDGEEAQEAKILTVDYVVDNSLPQDFFVGDILQVVHKLKIARWKHLYRALQGDETVVGKVKVRRISGALTNAVYKVEVADVVARCPPLLLRIYGPNVTSVIDRDYELGVLTRLAKKNIGAKLLGCFSNGRIEQWLNDTNPLTKDLIVLSKISRTIARRMKELHIGVNLTFQELQAGAMVWNNIDSWSRLVARFLQDSQVDEKLIFLSDYKKFVDIIQLYRSWLSDKYHGKINEHLSFCHNDTQYGNLLLSYPNSLVTMDGQPAPSSSTKLSSDEFLKVNDDKKLVVIDFEYSGPNVDAYDIANHFCEWMADYHSPDKSYFLDPARYPDVEQQINFLTSYVKFGTSSTAEVTTPEEILKIKKLYNEVLFWRPAVNIGWCLWGIVQSPLFTQTQDPKEKVVNETTYKVVEDMEKLDIKDEPEEAEAGGDIDNFDYFKYSMNKAALVWGDLIQYGIVKPDDLDEAHRQEIKVLPAKFYDL